MGRIALRSFICALILSTSGMPANGDEQPPPLAPIDYDAQLRDTDAAITGQQHLSNRKHEPLTSSSPKILTSYQRVCSATAKDNYATADTCHRSTSLCTTKQTPAWIMTAPATPTPRPNDWTNTGRITCRAKSQARPQPVVTAADFRRLPIPPALITIQPDPAKSPTLINIPTNLYTTRSRQILVTTVLGQPVRVRATPIAYTWRYGDGTIASTRTPGGPYPDLSTGHTYTRPGTYTVTLTTTFTGEYSAANGPWQPIAGTAVIPAPTPTLTAREARNQLTR